MPSSYGFQPSAFSNPDDSTYLKPTLTYRARRTLSLDIPSDKSLHFVLQHPIFIAWRTHTADWTTTGCTRVVAVASHGGKRSLHGPKEHPSLAN